MKFGFIGLGHQGAPMADRMIASGLETWVWARRPEVLDAYQRSPAVVATSPAAIGAACDVIGLCLYDAAATDDVLFGPDGVMLGVERPKVLAIHSTVGPHYVTELADRVAARNVSVVDAPVSGGPAAATGELLVMVGGDPEAVRACQPMFACYSNRVVQLGGVGAAQSAKLINNILMTAITGLVFDAFALGSRLGVSEGALGEVLANGSAANPSVGNVLAMGEAEFSLRAWPTLH